MLSYQRLAELAAALATEPTNLTAATHDFRQCAKDAIALLKIAREVGLWAHRAESGYEMLPAFHEGLITFDRRKAERVFGEKHQQKMRRALYDLRFQTEAILSKYGCAIESFGQPPNNNLVILRFVSGRSNREDNFSWEI